MKNTLLLFLSFILVLSCSNDDDKKTTSNSEIIGTWKLIEVYADPGDGSGDFVSVESDKVITFNTNGTINSNADLCILFSDSGALSSGTFSETEMTITIADCDTSPSTVFFEIDGANLILSYVCIEGCQEKYSKEE